MVKGLVVTAYNSNLGDHLKVDGGEIVNVVKQHEAGWFWVEHTHGAGWVPVGSVLLGTNLKALYDFPASGPDEVSLQAGDVVVGFHQENEWWHGFNKGKTGAFPATYCEEYDMGGASVLLVGGPDPATGFSAGPSRGQRPNGVGRMSSADAMRGTTGRKSLATQMATSSQAAAFIPATERLSKAAAPAPRRAEMSEAEKKRWKGKNPLQFALVAHNMSYGVALACLIMGPFAFAWDNKLAYDCTGIDAQYTADCQIQYLHGGDSRAGTLTLVLAFVIPLFQYRYGLLWPTDSFSYRYRFPTRGLAYICFSGVAFVSSATYVVGSFMVVCGLMHCVATYRREAGDGRSKKMKEAGGNLVLPSLKLPSLPDQQWYNDRKDYIWFVAIYFIINIVLFFLTLALWVEAVKGQHEKLEDGTADPTDSTDAKLIKYGPVSYYGPFAKAFGALLNFNCALILIPVVRNLLKQVNNWSFSKNYDFTIAKFIPLSKNIAFHKLISFVVWGSAFWHTFFHFVNYSYAPDITMETFGLEPWVDGGMILVAMFFIYSAAADHVRHANYELFFFSHHWFLLFFGALLVHGPVFMYWAGLPILLYAWERYSQMHRGGLKYFVNQVQWTPPVLSVQFRPRNKEDFVFKEGQYLYLNAPHISAKEWHPFTISSAHGDLTYGYRVCGRCGSDLTVLQSHEQGRSEQYLCAKGCKNGQPLDKHETMWNDYVSCHIKIVPGGWTEKLKNYFEGMNPGDDYPFNFKHRDEKGELQMGKSTGPDGMPILRVDGPHAAPSQHYDRYQEVMVIGGGIGMTPCASILTAVLRYKWKKNFPPGILRFYWIVRHGEVEAFQWFINVLAKLENGLTYSRSQGQVDSSRYVEINIYVTSAPKEAAPAKQLRSAGTLEYPLAEHERMDSQSLYELMNDPSKVSSKQQTFSQRRPGPNDPKANNMRDVWVWSGRPQWESIFRQVEQEQTSGHVGVCFCGTPIIGADLKKNCRKFSDPTKNVQFTLHKENF